MKKCAWCQDQGLNEAYHDTEWGIPLHDDQKQFEFLMMEVMQCGLNWTMMLKKRDIFRQCFDQFDFHKIAEYDEAKVTEIMDTPGMIRSPRKIHAVINNAIKFQEIIKEFGSFDEFLWRYTNYKTLVYAHRTQAVASNALSDAISKELKRRGFKYLGSITVYSHLQAAGLINDHEESCFMYEKIMKEYPVQIVEEN